MLSVSSSEETLFLLITDVIVTDGGEELFELKDGLE